MRPGDLVSDRFEIEQKAGSGGMGVVYRAKDRHTGEPVALKVLHVSGSEARARFGREARVLADLTHPGIVRYVAHGETPKGERFLAMEWLAGEDLQDRLRREGLTLSESVRLALRVAEALAVAHARGIVHRDLKPSNVFLVDRQVDRVKVLDFGIARRKAGGSDATMVETFFGTSTGMVVGTLGYFAPEQARGARDIGPAADVFSLGCVLFRCVTGRQPFVADDPSAVLAKILFDEAPRARELRSDVPVPLDELLARMLAKDPAQRPKDAAAVVAEIGLLGQLDDTESARGASSPSISIGTGERRLVSVVVAAPGGPTEETTGGSRGEATLATPATAERMPTEAELAPTMLGDATSADAELAEAAADFDAEQDADRTRIEGQPEWKEVRMAAAALGARIERLADGVVVATLAEAGAATDQAVRAARCALALRQHWPDAPLGLATGRGVLVHRLPVGEVIDRAMRLLRRAQHGAPAAAGGRGGVPIDEVTAGLLDARFELGGDARGLELRGERESVEAVRTLLGKTTPCVGREAELSVLRRLYEECADAPQAQAVLLTAPSGIGKSRLRYELLRELDREDGDLPRPEVWIARGDAMSAGSPFGMLAQAIRRAAGVQHGEALVLRQQKLRARIARYLEGAALDRVTELLAEIIGAPVSDEAASVQLRAARQDPVLMGDQRRRAWEDWLAAECAHQPVLLVLEDLQWGDVPTNSFVDGALRNLREKPFMVLAIARPDVYELFPRLWGDRRVQEIRLGELTRRPAERLVRQVLGAQVPAATVQRIVELSGGNAFYLEELIRTVAEGQGDALPETVLAMVQGRLEALDADARWILRAASVFGGVFWRGGLFALLGGAQRTTEIDQWLAVLIDRELVSRRNECRFPGQEELTFRSALVREAAYAMLTDDDRVLGHRLAAGWLEHVGETDAVVLAEHWERAKEPANARGWYESAAVAALEGNDFAACRALAERALACGATGEAAGRMRLLESEAHRWAGEHAAAAERAAEAMVLLPDGSELWFAAAGEVAEACGKIGDRARLEGVAADLETRPLDPARGGLPIIAVARTAAQLLYVGETRGADRLLARVAGPAEQLRGDPGAVAWVARVQGTRAMFAGDVGEFLRVAKKGVLGFEQAGDLRNACRQQNSAGFAAIECGAHAEAETVLRGALAAAERMGLKVAEASTRQNLGVVCCRQGALDEARALQTAALDAFRAQGDLRMEGGSLLYLALVDLAAGDLDRARENALAAAKVLEAVPPGLCYALATLAEVDRARGDVDGALAAAGQAMRLCEELGEIEEGEAAVRLAWAEALAAAGRTEEAAQAFRSAAARLQARADRISDPILRQCFLENVPDNARTLERASAF